MDSSHPIQAAVPASARGSNSTAEELRDVLLIGFGLGGPSEVLDELETSALNVTSLRRAASPLPDKLNGSLPCWFSRAGSLPSSSQSMDVAQWNA